MIVRNSPAFDRHVFASSQDRWSVVFHAMRMISTQICWQDPCWSFCKLWEQGKKRIFVSVNLFRTGFWVISIGMACRECIKNSVTVSLTQWIHLKQAAFLLCFSQDCITEEWLSFSHRIIVQSFTFSGKFGPNAYVETEIKPPLSLYYISLYSISQL